MAEQLINGHTAYPDTLKMERLAWVRFPSDRDVGCKTDDSNTGWLGKLRAISCSGIVLALRRRFEPGAVLNVDLESEAGWPSPLSVRVIHATQERYDLWLIGCAFARPLTEDEFHAFLSA